MRKLYIIGAGGFGREVAWLVERINKVKSTWDMVGFLDDADEKVGTLEGNYPVVGKIDFLEEVSEEVYVICAVGSALVRKSIITKIKEFNNQNVHFATVVDPSVIMSETVTIGEGSIICAGTIITVNIKIGNHVIINLDCTLGHDDIIDDYVTMYPSVNVSGMVHVNECSELGTGMQVIQGKSIAANTIIGAGSVVVKDIVESGTYVGAPTKRIK